MARDFVLIPVQAEELGFTLETGVRRKRNNRNNRRRQQRRDRKLKKHLQHRFTHDGILTREIQPSSDSSSSDSEMDQNNETFVIFNNHHEQQLPCGHPGDYDSFSDTDLEGDIALEFDEPARQRNKKKNKKTRREKRKGRKAIIKKKLETNLENNDEDDSSSEDEEIFDEIIPLDFSSNFTSPKAYEIIEDEEKNKFELSLQLVDVSPEDLQVIVKDLALTVIASKEEVSEDGSGKLFQKYTKVFKLPLNIVEKEIKSILTPEGLLKIEGPLKPQENPEETEEVGIPIEIQIDDA